MFDVLDDTWVRINQANHRVGWHIPTVGERDQIEALARDLNREFFPEDPETARPRSAADELRYMLKDFWEDVC